jgi:RNA polymerase sigma factor (sigma-70 family)
MDYSNDIEILRECLSGHRNAQEAFVRMFSDLVYRSIQHALMVNNVRYERSDLEDLHNTVFVKLFEKRCKKLKQYKGSNGCSLKSWVRLLTVRLVIDHLRKSHTDALTREGRTVPLDAIVHMKGETPEPWALIERKEQFLLITEGLQKILPRDKLFLKLHFLKGLSIPKVAVIMGLSEANAHSLKHRAIKRLRKKIVQISEKNLFS